MKKVVFCTVAWMKNYLGSGDDKPKNGGKYIKEHEDGGEVFNFVSRNHYCYGYVMHYGNELHIERYDKVLKNHSEVNDVTVVWVATDGERQKIVGWYEHATMYREWQMVFDPETFGGWRDYSFLAKDTDCYLLDEKDRTYEISRASVAGRGRGMGQSQIWYAESDYAQENIIPEVLEYLDSVRDKAVFYTDVDLEEVAEDKGLSVKELLESARNKEDCMEALRLINLALKKEDSFETRIERANALYLILGFYDEAAVEYKRALEFHEDPLVLSDYMYLHIPYTKVIKQWKVILRSL